MGFSESGLASNRRVDTSLRSAIKRLYDAQSDLNDASNDFEIRDQLFELATSIGLIADKIIPLLNRGGHSHKDRKGRVR